MLKLSDTLLSILAIRGGELVDSIFARPVAPEPLEFQRERVKERGSPFKESPV